MTVTVANKFLSHCNSCGGETQHEAKGTASRRRSDETGFNAVSWGTTWKLLQCCGCEEASMKMISWCSEDHPMDAPDERYFPPRVSRKPPTWLTEDPELDDYIGLFQEIYTALHADSRRLAIMGARAVLDLAASRMLGADPGSFSAGMQKLVDDKRLTEDERKLIDAAFDAGSAAMHRSHQPSVDEVNTVIDILERMVHAEVLAKKVKSLEDATPKRPRTPKPSPKA